MDQAAEPSSAEKPEPFVRSLWETWRMGTWALGLSVLSPYVQLAYFAAIQEIGPHLVGVVLSWIFRIPFLIFVVFRLRATPEPVAGADAFFTGLGGRSTLIQVLAAAGFLYHLLFFISFLKAGVWVGVIASTLWMVWLYGMTVREQARCYQLRRQKLGLPPD